MCGGGEGERGKALKENSLHTLASTSTWYMYMYIVHVYALYAH